MVILAVVAIGVLAGGFMLDRWMDGATADLESVFDARQTYRDSWIVCEGSMSLSCAQDAANRAELPVAWVVNPAEFGLRLDAMAAARGKARGFAAQELKGKSFIVSIVTGDDGSSRGQRIGVVTAAGRRGQLWGDGDGSVTLRWSSGGVSHHIAVVSMAPTSTTATSERTLAERLFEAVRLTKPVDSL
jgi:hypothetical protein